MQSLIASHACVQVNTASWSETWQWGTSAGLTVEGLWAGGGRGYWRSGLFHPYFRQERAHGQHQVVSASAGKGQHANQLIKAGCDQPSDCRCVQKNVRQHCGHWPASWVQVHDPPTTCWQMPVCGAECGSARRVASTCNLPLASSSVLANAYCTCPCSGAAAG